MTKKQLGKYEIIMRLGRGGMAEVYKGYQGSLDRHVAIKLLHPFLADDPEFKDRFEREARNVARLRHPNIVQVYDFEYDAESESYYMVMELIDGQTLKERLTGMGAVRLPINEVLRIMREALEALAYAHSRGMIHRDMKPANLMIDSDGRVVLTDFGIAKIVTGNQFTASGGMVGTPAYMAPEQGLGEAGDERSDIYSMGVILFQLATGKLPYEAETPLAVILKHVNEPLPSPRSIEPDMPPFIEDIILKAMSKDPHDRYQSAEEMLVQVRAALDGTLSAKDAAVPLVAGPGGPTMTASRLVDTATGHGDNGEPPALSTSTAVHPPNRNSWVGLGAVAIISLILLFGLISTAMTGVVPIFGIVVRPSPTSTSTLTPIPTKTPLPTFTPTVTSTMTPSPTPTATATATLTQTNTPTATFTPSTTPTATATITLTPSDTATPTFTPTFTTTWTPTASATPTLTPSDTPTPTPTLTPSNTSTPTIDVTITLKAATQQAIDRTGTSNAKTVAAIVLTQLAGVTPTPNYTQTALKCVNAYLKIAPPTPDPKNSIGTIRVGISFTQTIILQNNSSCDWLPEMYLFYKDGEQFSAPVQIKNDETANVKPGGQAHFTFKGITPTKGGLYTGHWEVHLKDGPVIEPLLAISFFAYGTPPG